MNISHIRQIASQGESATVEFKKSTAQLQRVFETVCAFLNSGGGTILIGVTDKGQVIGQEISDSTQQSIAHEVSKLEPPALVDIKYILLNEESRCRVISLTVSPGPYAPYTYEGRAFQRNQTTTIRMTQHRYEQMIIERDHLNHPWEQSFAEDYTLQDLDQEEIRRTIDQAIRANRLPTIAIQAPLEETLANLGLLRHNKLLNAAVVLFSRKITGLYLQCGLRLACFKGKSTLGDFLDNKQIEGNAFYLLEEAETFLRRHLSIASTFRKDSFERIDKPALPSLALREALINALCHRDYSFDAPTSSLAIFDDRVEIWNYGGLPKGVALEDLKKPHISKPRNKLIADIFYKRNFIEKWGTGTTRIIQLCKESAIPEPIFVEFGCGLTVIFPFTENFEAETSFSLNKRQKEILQVLSNTEELSLQAIAKKMVEASSTRTLRRDLAFLRDLHLVECRGRGPYASWFIKK